MKFVSDTILKGVLNHGHFFFPEEERSGKAAAFGGTCAEEARNSQCSGANRECELQVQV